MTDCHEVKEHDVANTFVKIYEKNIKNNYKKNQTNKAHDVKKNIIK